MGGLVGSDHHFPLQLSAQAGPPAGFPLASRPSRWWGGRGGWSGKRGYRGSPRGAGGVMTFGTVEVQGPKEIEIEWLQFLCHF